MSKQSKLDLTNKHSRCRFWSGVSFSLISTFALAVGLVSFSHDGDLTHLYGGISGAILMCCCGLYYHLWYYGKFRDPEAIERQIKRDGQRQLAHDKKLMRLYCFGFLFAPALILIVVLAGIENAPTAFIFYLFLVITATFMRGRQLRVNPNID